MVERGEFVKRAASEVGRIAKAVGREVKDDLLAPITYPLRFKDREVHGPATVYYLGIENLMIAGSGIAGAILSGPETGAVSVITAYASTGIGYNHQERISGWIQKGVSKVGETARQVGKFATVDNLSLAAFISSAPIPFLQMVTHAKEASGRLSEVVVMNMDVPLAAFLIFTSSISEHRNSRIVD